MRRKSLVDKAIRRRFAVTLKGNEGTFSGVLTDSDARVWVFDDCATVPATAESTPQPIAGRVFVECASVAYLQELA